MKNFYLITKGDFDGWDVITSVYTHLDKSELEELIKQVQIKYNRINYINDSIRSKYYETQQKHFNSLKQSRINEFKRVSQCKWNHPKHSKKNPDNNPIVQQWINEHNAQLKEANNNLTHNNILYEEIINKSHTLAEFELKPFVENILNSNNDIKNLIDKDKYLDDVHLGCKKIEIMNHIVVSEYHFNIDEFKNNILKFLLK